MNNYKEVKILENTHIGENVYKLVVEGKFEGRPGEFYMLRNWDKDPLLSRPIAVCDLDENSLTMLYMVFGRGTRDFSKLLSGQTISVMGPLGNGFKTFGYKKVAIVAGSVGIAPMYYLAKNLDCKIDIYAGFANDSFFIDEFKEIVDNIYISSDSGKVGFHGNVVELIKSVGKIDEYDQIFVCGTNPMAKAMMNNFDNSIMQVSFEARMACGLGVCLGCAVKTTEGMKRACVEGPVFNASEVILDA